MIGGMFSYRTAMCRPDGFLQLPLLFSCSISFKTLPSLASSKEGNTVKFPLLVLTFHQSVLEVSHHLASSTTGDTA